MEQKEITKKLGGRKETIEQFMAKEKTKKCVELLNKGYTMRHIYKTTGISFKVTQKVRHELARREHVKRMEEIEQMNRSILLRKANQYTIIETNKRSNIFKRIFGFLGILK